MIEFSAAGVALAAPGQTPRVLLAGVSATLDQPLTCVVGANGSGKSTLLSLINGLVTATSGNVEVGGLDVATNLKAVRRSVGFVFSDPAAQLVMPTVIEDVELSLRALPKAARAHQAMAVLESLGIADLAQRSVFELSGGQRQLVAIASVMATDPQVLVLDEPTTLLDLVNREKIRATIAGLVARGVQIVFSTHDLDFALDAHDCLLIDEGRLAMHGVPAQVCAHYRELVASRMTAQQ